MPKAPIDRDLYALLQTVKESPFDDLPRMILADWLTDRDDPRGELIRVQCELRKTPFGNPNRTKLTRREKKLLKEHGSTWTLGEHEDVTVRFQRGLLHLTIDGPRFNASSIPKELRGTLEQGWVETIKFNGLNMTNSKLAKYRPLEHITHLDLSQSYLYEEQFLELVASKHLQPLVILDLGYTHFDFEILLQVARSSHLPNLQYVLRDCDGRLGSLRRLFQRNPKLIERDWFAETRYPSDSPGLLDLAERGVEVESLIDHPHLKNLRALILHSIALGDAGMEVLLTSRDLGNLEILDLGHNSLTDAGAVLLAERGNFPNLDYLQLEYNSISNRGLVALANAPYLENLKMLDLGPNRVGDEGMIAVANSPSLKNLELISIWGNEVGDAGIIALANSPNCMNLRELYAGNNLITDAGAKALIESKYLNNLRLLRFENNTGENYNSISGGMRKKLRERFNEGVEVSGPIS